MPLFIYKILIKKRYYIGKYVILKQYIRDAQMSAYVDQNHAPSLTDVQLKLKQKGETDEASGKKTNEKSTHACRDCLHIDFSAGSYGAGNAFY